MKEYIERAHLLKNLGYDDCDELVARRCRDALSADPVHVAGGCYCRECKYFIEASDWPIPIGGRNTQCIKVQSTRKPDDFCSEGKKKEPD